MAWISVNPHKSMTEFRWKGGEAEMTHGHTPNEFPWKYYPPMEVREGSEYSQTVI